MADNALSRYRARFGQKWTTGEQDEANRQRFIDAADKPTLAGKALGLLGLDESGERNATSWQDAALSTLHMPLRAAEGAYQAVTAPARAYRGEIPDENMIGEGLNFAGNMAVGGSAIPRPGNALASNSIRPGTLLADAGENALSRPGRALDPLGYYSQAYEAANALRQAKGTGEQFRAMLKKEGVKDAEIAATGLDAVLSKPAITRDEIVKHLEGNRVGLKEVVNTRDPDAFARATYGKPLSELTPDQQAFVREEVRIKAPGAEPKWQNYSLDPSNPTYRETVIHLPGVEGDRTWMEMSKRIAEIGDQQYALGKEWVSATPERRSAIDAEVARITAERNDLVGKRSDHERSLPVFESGHFSEPNIVGHLMTSLTKHEGKPVYTIDQIQSDWGQKLRDGGVRDEAKIAELKAKLEKVEKFDPSKVSDLKSFSSAQGLNVAFRYDGKYFTDTLHHSARQSDIDSLVRRLATPQDRQLLEAELRTAEAATPGHPLVNTTDQWVNTTLRRGIQQAADAGAEFMAIPSGKTVLSYNPGDAHGMETFYNRIVPKNLGNILGRLDNSIRPVPVSQLETPGKVLAGDGFTVFPLTQKAIEEARKGLPLFANGKQSALPGTMIAEAGDNDDLISILRKYGLLGTLGAGGAAAGLMGGAQPSEAAPSNALSRR